MQQMAAEFGLSVADPIRRGTAFNALIDTCLFEQRFVAA